MHSVSSCEADEVVASANTPQADLFCISAPLEHFRFELLFATVLGPFRSAQAWRHRLARPPATVIAASIFHFTHQGGLRSAQTVHIFSI